MRKMVGLAIAAAFALALAGCSSQEAQGGYDFTDGSVGVNGSTLEVVLEANQTTGFEWTVGVDGEGLELKDSVYAEGKDESGAVGVAGTMTFTFEGKAAGDQTLTFSYARPWEDALPEKTVVVTVKTNDKGSIVGAKTVGSDGSGGDFSA